MESVEYKLQCMVPDLTALLERGLFTKEELRKVLEKRSQFEYSIRSSNRSPEDFYKQPPSPQYLLILLIIDTFNMSKNLKN